jgi:CheY-like chemotaxis protein
MPNRLALRGIRCLVVDDDPASAKLASVVLRGEGAEARVAGSAEEALQILETYRPHVILLDLILPLMSGLLLAQTLKARKETRDIVLIVVTVFNGTETQQLIRDAGCAAYVQKPIDPLMLAQVVVDHLVGEL